MWLRIMYCEIYILVYNGERVEDFHVHAFPFVRIYKYTKQGLALYELQLDFQMEMGFFFLTQ